jgi:WD40 repeat protein
MNRYKLLTTIACLFAITTLRADDQPAKKLPEEPPVVRSVNFSPDGTLLAASAMPKDRGGIVCVWDVATRKLVSRYDRGGETPIAAFSADPNSLVIANGLKLLPVLDPMSGKKVGEIGPLPAEATSLWSLAAGRWLIVGKDNVFRLWEEKDKKAIHELVGARRIRDWAVSPGGKWLFASGDGDKLWDLNTGKEVEGAFKQRPGTVNAPAFLAEDRLLVGSNIGSHKLVEIPSGKDVFRFKNEGGTGQITYSPAAGMLACRYYSSDRVALTPYTLRPPTDAEKTRTSALLKECDSDDYATRERAAASLVELGAPIEPLLKQASTDGPSAEVRMRARVARETILNKPKHNLAGHTEDIRVMRFSPDGKLFATGGADGLVILWDPASGKEVARFSDIRD